mmetsp:Transcript_3538/g.9955  ORF Transcript_3538/g.9955 Transcript_3538/m.9955 type:complete len:269 (+) Transcript_3538:362-1168(+)
MLITLLSYFDQKKNREFDNGETCDSYSDTSPTGSFTGDTMSREGAHYYRDDEEDWEQIRHPVIPLSAEEDYEIVIPPSNFHDASAANPSTAGNTGILQRIKEWRRQQAIQRNQLGPSINTTFAELSKEDPEQMERDNIQRAMELSMLDVALVHYSHQHDQHRINNSQQAQKKLPHEILGVSKNAKTTEIKAAYRKLARLHVSTSISFFLSRLAPFYSGTNLVRGFDRGASRFQSRNSSMYHFSFCPTDCLPIFNDTLRMLNNCSTAAS